MLPVYDVRNGSCRRAVDVLAYNVRWWESVVERYVPVNDVRGWKLSWVVDDTAYDARDGSCRRAVDVTNHDVRARISQKYTRGERKPGIRLVLISQECCDEVMARGATGPWGAEGPPPRGDPPTIRDVDLADLPPGNNTDAPLAAQRNLLLCQQHKRGVLGRYLRCVRLKRANSGLLPQVVVCTAASGTRPAGDGGRIEE